VDIDYNAYTKYYNSQIVRIRRSGRQYVNTWTPSQSSAAGNTMTTTFSSAWTGHEDMTVFNNTMQSFARASDTGTAGIPASFWTVRITDYETREIQAERGAATLSTVWPTFNFICWTGSSVYDDADGHLVPTKSLVQSIEYVEYTRHWK
jgi:hypothetical protein